MNNKFNCSRKLNEERLAYLILIVKLILPSLDICLNKNLFLYLSTLATKSLAPLCLNTVVYKVEMRIENQ